MWRHWSDSDSLKFKAIGWRKLTCNWLGLLALSAAGQIKLIFGGYTIIDKLSGPGSHTTRQ